MKLELSYNPDDFLEELEEFHENDELTEPEV